PGHGDVPPVGLVHAAAVGAHSQSLLAPPADQPGDRPTTPRVIQVRDVLRIVLARIPAVVGPDAGLTRLPNLPAKPRRQLRVLQNLGDGGSHATRSRFHGRTPQSTSPRAPTTFAEDTALTTPGSPPRRIPGPMARTRSPGLNRSLGTRRTCRSIPSASA